MSLWSVADWMLDPSIVLSFDRTGFRRHARSFLKGDLEPLHTCLMLEEINVSSEDPLTPLRIATPLSLAALTRARYRNEDVPLGYNRGEDEHLEGINTHQLKIITSYKY